MSRLEFVPLSPADGVAKSFQKGTFVVGRKDFGVENTKISRRHLKLFINDWTVSIERVGANVVKIRRANGESLDLEKGRPYLLHNGDEISLQGGKHQFKVIINP